MKLIMDKEIAHKIVAFESDPKAPFTELGEILFANGLWGQRGMAEAIAHYIHSLGYKKEISNRRAELLDHILEIYRLLEDRDSSPPKPYQEWFYRTTEILHSYGRI